MKRTAGLIALLVVVGCDGPSATIPDLDPQPAADLAPAQAEPDLANPRLSPECTGTGDTGGRAGGYSVDATNAIAHYLDGKLNVFLHTQPIRCWPLRGEPGDFVVRLIIDGVYDATTTFVTTQSAMGGMEAYEWDAASGQFVSLAPTFGVTLELTDFYTTGDDSIPCDGRIRGGGTGYNSDGEILSIAFDAPILRSSFPSSCH